MNKHGVAVLIVLSLGLVLALATVTVLARGNALASNWWVIAGGGDAISRGKVSVHDTVGQPIVGPSAEGNISLTAGYWYGSASGALPGSEHTRYFPIVLRDSH
jgi:hypothetical protein